MIDVYLRGLLTYFTPFTEIHYKIVEYLVFASNGQSKEIVIINMKVLYDELNLRIQ